MPDHICKDCGKALSSASNLTQHMLTHTGEKPYQCEVCSKRFSQAGSLTRHMRIHTGQRPFQCEVCGKSFTTKGNLTVHEPIHTGEKSFQCHVCGKAFTSQSNLIQHARIHTGARPYPCPACGMSFTQLISLQRHQKTAHDENRPFPCHLCSCRFNRECDLTRHRRQAHQSGSATQSVAVRTHTESVGMVTVTTQTRVSSGYTTTISTVTSPMGSAYVVNRYSSLATITTAIQASGLVTTNTDPNLPGSGSGSIPENASTAELSSMHDYNTDDSSDDIDVVN